MAPMPKKKLTLTMGDVDGGKSTLSSAHCRHLGLKLADIAEGELNLALEKLQQHHDSLA